MDASIDKDCGARAGHVEDMLPAWRPHLFGETPNPVFETSKGGGSGRCPPGWGAGLAPLAQRAATQRPNQSLIFQD